MEELVMEELLTEELVMEELLTEELVMGELVMEELVMGGAQPLTADAVKADEQRDERGGPEHRVGRRVEGGGRRVEVGGWRSALSRKQQVLLGPTSGVSVTR